MPSRLNKDILEQVYLFIKQYVTQHTYPPTQREIADHCYLARTSVPRYLTELEKQGRIHIEPKVRRGITLSTLPNAKDRK